MKQSQQNQKRDMIAIMLKILDIAIEPVKKTHILYSAGINFYQLSRYLNLLLKLGLIEELTEPYSAFRTTEKGRACLRLFSATEDLDSTETVIAEGESLDLRSIRSGDQAHSIFDPTK